MLPAYVANMAPVFAAKILGKWGAFPIDFGKTLGGKRICGDHKTIRGFVCGLLAAWGILFLQRYLMNSSGFFFQLSIIQYEAVNLWLFGFLFGFGALFGDAVKSFFKRRVGVPPGERWIPWDQLDFIFGALLFVSFVYIPQIHIILIILLFSPILHILTNQIGYLLKIKNTKW